MEKLICPECSSEDIQITTMVKANGHLYPDEDNPTRLKGVVFEDQDYDYPRTVKELIESGEWAGISCFYCGHYWDINVD